MKEITKTRHGLTIVFAVGFIISILCPKTVVSDDCLPWPPSISEGYIDKVVGDPSSNPGDGCSGDPGPMLGDGGCALLTPICGGDSIAVDNHGNLFLTDGDTRVRMVDRSTGLITTVAGNGSWLSEGPFDEDYATEVGIGVGSIAVDHVGNLYIGERDSYGVHKVDLSTGLINTVYDDVMETCIAVDVASERLYWIDSGSPWSITAFNLIELEKVVGFFPAPGGDCSCGDVAYTSIAVDTEGFVYVTEKICQQVFKIDPETKISTLIAGKGDGESGFDGDGGLATEASLYLNGGDGIAIDGVGNVYFYDSGNHRVRRVDAVTGIITTVAGNGTSQETGDGGPATDAGIWRAGDYTAHLAMDSLGNLFIPDRGIRCVFLPFTIANSPPEAQPAPLFQVVEINVDPIQVLAAVSDLDGDTLSYEWVKDGEILASGTVETVQGGDTVPIPDLDIPAGDPRFTLGSHEFSLLVSDGVNDPVSKSVQVKVIDTTAPSLSPVPSALILWPPNHELHNVTIQANAFDNGGGVISLGVTVESSEPADTDGDGQTIPDYYIDSVNNETGMMELRLRAERAGKGEGRTYTITITATDEIGNQSVATVEILAPHDRRKK